MKQSISSYINNKAISQSCASRFGVIDSSITSATTMQYNFEYETIRKNLAQKVANKTISLSKKLQSNPKYTNMRDDGVNLAWEYEQADIKMGGRGSERWNLKERRDIRLRGRVRNAEGHHGRNVSDHPEDQVNPDNIKFYRSKTEHLKKGHDGDWKKESDMPYNSKEEMLRKTNFKRVVRNEIFGIAVASAIGFGIGLTIGAAISLAQNGISPESIKIAMVEGRNAGIQSFAFSVVGYTIQKIVSFTIQGIAKNLGVQIGEKLKPFGTALAGLVSGSLCILVFSTIEFCQLKKVGKTNLDAFLTVAKNAIISFSILCFSMLTMVMFGPTAAGIVAIVYPVGYLTYTISKLIKDRKTLEKVREYTIQYSKPQLI